MSFIYRKNSNTQQSTKTISKSSKNIIIATATAAASNNNNNNNNSSQQQQHHTISKMSSLKIGKFHIPFLNNTAKTAPAKETAKENITDSNTNNSQQSTATRKSSSDYSTSSK